MKAAMLSSVAALKLHGVRLFAERIASEAYAARKVSRLSFASKQISRLRDVLQVIYRVV